MKTIVSSLFFLFCMWLFVSCHKEPEIVSFENVTASVTLQSVIGDKALITFTCSGTWTATTDASWINLSPLSGGAGTSQVTVTAMLENNTDSQREAKVKLTSGNETCEISVSQEVGDYIVPEKNVYLAEVDGGLLAIQFKSNVELENLTVYTPAEPTSWLKQELPIRLVSTGLYEVVWSIAPNKGGMSRFASLLFMKDTAGVQKELASVKISQLGGQVLESVDFSDDGKIDTLQLHTEGNGIPIVLMGDGFVDQEISDGTYRNVMMKAMENLFSEEPIKSLRAYFDVFMIYAVSENNDFGMGYETAFSCKLAGGNSTAITGDDGSVQVYVGKVLRQEKDRKNSLAVVILNSSAYAGTTYMGYQEGENKYVEFAIAYCPVIENLESEYFRQVLVHEAVGHGFGKLEDEYAYPEKESISTLEKQKITAMQANGWSQNVDFTSVADSVRWTAFLEDSRYRNENLGVYEGACTYLKGVYRPSEDSMMNSNTCGFNAPSRKSLYEKVMKLGEGMEQIDYEDFVRFDQSHHPASLSVKSSRLGGNIRPFTRPVWVGRNLQP